MSASEERFWSRVDRGSAEDCWPWTGRIGTHGYGHFAAGGAAYLAHRWSYAHSVAPIPDGLVIDHLCRVRCCVNPQHLEAVTVRENTLRGIGLTAAQARQTHCKNGHEFTAANTLRARPNRRICRTCAKRRSAEFNARRALANQSH